MTFVSYPNITVVSQSRNYRLEIQGTPGEKEFFRDQSGFVYRLLRDATREVVWEWKPAEQQGLADYPQEAWVSDEGWVVVLLREWFQSGLLVLSPSGDSRMLRHIQSFGQGEPGILDNEPDVHIGHTSAGPHWDRCSVALFHQYQAKPCWSMLTWWARRIVVDLENGIVLDVVPSELSMLAATNERSWMLDQLKRGAVARNPKQDRNSSWRRWRRVIWPTYTAAYHAGLAGVADAAPYLQSLESSPITGYSTGDSWMSLTHLPLRLIAKMSLLRLGIEPRWFANFIVTSDRTKIRCTYPERRLRRIEDVLAEGVSQRTLLEQAGVPEFIRDRWDYGVIDAGRAHTIRIHWHDKHKVSIDWHDKQKAVQQCEEHRKAIERDPPVAEHIERVDLPPWAADPVRECCIADCH